VAAIPNRKDPVTAAAKLKTVSVGRTLGGPAQFADLTTAFRKLPPQGAVIQLVGDGPFFLPATSITHRGTVVLTAAAGARPLVVLVPGRRDRTAAVLTVRHTSLTLLGVHLFVDAARFPPGEKRTLVDIDSGDLTVRNGSITVRGERDAATVAFRVSGSVDRQASAGRRVLLDRVLLRGNRCTVLEVTNPVAEIVASNCLFLTGKSPVVRLLSRSAAATMTERPVSANSVIAAATTRSSPPQQGAGADESGRQRRVLRLISCTSVGGHAAFELSPPADHTGSMTEFVVVNSLFATDQVNGETVLMSLHNWPQTARPVPGGSLLAGLRWNGRGTVFAGWKSLLRSGPKSPLTVDGIDGWQRLWRNPDDDDHFLPSPWPAKAVTQLDTAIPVAFDSRSLASSGVQATDHKRPGCLVDRLQTPRALTLERAAIIGRRPRLAVSDRRDRGPTKTIAIDLKRQDLGKLISVGDWPDGTLFVVSGSGNRFSSPLRVRGKSLRIRFEQTGDKPLVILPRHINDETGERAFITIRGGHIALSGGSFHVRSSPTKAPVKWFLSVTDGGFSLERCVLVGPMRESPGYKGLIHWLQTASRPVGDRQSRPVPRKSGLIADSYLTTDGLLLDAQFRHSSLEMTNSILASLSDLFLLRMVGLDSKIDAAVDAKHCTFSAANAVFVVRATPFPKRSVDPLRVFVDESVFLHPVDVGPKRRTHPVILSCADLSRPQDQIDWWGTGNGFAGELAGYLTTAATGGASQNFETAWKTAWGADHVLRPLAKPGAVLIRDKFPHRDRLTPEAFRLHSSCTAFQWSAVGVPLGAEIKRLPKSTINLPSRSKPASKKKKKKKKGGINRPDF